MVVNSTYNKLKNKSYMRENKLYVSGKLAYSFGKNGKGLSDEFETINSIIKLFSKDNYITIHKTFVEDE